MFVCEKVWDMKTMNHEPYEWNEFQKPWNIKKQSCTVILTVKSWNTKLFVSEVKKKYFRNCNKKRLIFLYI